MTNKPETDQLNFRAWKMVSVNYNDSLRLPDLAALTNS